jgi:uncharacterized protein (DUF1778 family)
MAAKTSQLQIRISPSQKAALKSLAKDEGMSVSAYVLSRALPSARRELEEKLHALADGADREAALEDLASYLGHLSEDGFRQALAGSGPTDLPPVAESYAAAAVEREAAGRGTVPPSWVRALAPLERPHFEWELRSLRPHLMRMAPPAYKRRRLFVVPPGSPEPPAARSAAADSDGLLRRYDAALADQGVDVELCVVGGAVLRLAFASEPGTRRPGAVLAGPEVALAARRRAAEKGRVALDRLESVARDLVGRHPGGTASFEGRALRVLSAPPDYVLAMRCLALSFAPDDGTEDDIRYLLRFMGLHRLDQAMVAVDRYLNPRQRPADLEIRMERLLR